VGQLTRVTLPDGSFLTYTYDPAHRLTGIADNLGNRIAYTLDLMGNRTKEEVFDPGNVLAQTRNRVYSNINRLSQEIGAQSQTTSFAYDNQGNTTSITDPLNRVTANAFDALNRLKQMTDPAAGVTRYGYDGIDQLTSVTDPRNNATTYTVDGLGNLTAQLSPDTGSATNVQDAAGNIVSSTDAKGQTTTSTYDALNRLTRIVYAQATGSQLKQIDYAYDQGSFGIGRLTTISETSAAGNLLQTIAYGYDQKGRVTSEARTIGGVIATTGYSYDAAGRMTGMTYPSGRTLTYAFDALGRVNRIETSGGGTSQVVLQDVAYQPFGPVKGFTFGNLQPYARGFDLDGRIASHSLADQTKVLAFDAASRITRIESQGAPTNFADYGYDALDRLTSTILPASTFGFSYDPVGNRLSKSTASGTDSYSYPPTSNRLSSISGGTTKTYAHDPNGSITSDGLVGFVYDPRGRLVASTSAIGTTTYQVNALGQRVRKTSSLGDIVFHYDTQGRLIAESAPTGAPLREYLWLGDQPVAVAAYSGGGACPASPSVDTSRSFSAFERRERMEVRSGRPGERGWEWGLGTNTRDFEASARADLDWVSGKPYGFQLSYDGAGNARVVVRDGTAELFNLVWSGGMDTGNALRFVVRSPEGIGAGNRIALAITSIDGQPVADTLVTAGDDTASNVSRVYAGESLRNGYTVEGTVTFTFTGGYPPRGSRLDLTVTAGNVTCEGSAEAGPPVLYYVHSDHLNTPRAITNQAQQLLWRWENQEPFGNSPPEENPSGIGSFEFPLRFPGTYADRETGTLYNGHRDLDPATGRYFQPEPLGLFGDINLYRYARNNPLRFIDPDGRQAVPVPAPTAPPGTSSPQLPSAPKGHAVPVPGARERPTDRPDRADRPGSSAANDPSFGDGGGGGGGRDHRCLEAAQRCLDTLNPGVSALQFLDYVVGLCPAPTGLTSNGARCLEALGKCLDGHPTIFPGGGGLVK
jgi:RHS repeat-associated protein